jgi:hypothetical protein
MWVVAVLLLVVACGMWRNEQTYVVYPQEKTLSFAESIGFQEDQDLLERILEHKYGGFGVQPYNWLRNPHNLWSTYHVLKQVGLTHFVSQARYHQPLYGTNPWGYDWQGMSAADVVHMLREAYHVEGDRSDYFQKFWMRRKAEGNATVVMSILSDLENFYGGRPDLPVNNELMNDTLFTLLAYNVALNESDSSAKPNLTFAFFKYLKTIGMERSAYNLLYVLPATKGVVLDKDALVSTLHADTTTNAVYYWELQEQAWIPGEEKGP